jgi:predicted transcriptional regulator of viral defense system
MTKENDELKSIALISEALIKISALEKLLIDKKIITSQDLSVEINSISRLMARSILKSANVKGDLDKILDDLESGKEL